MKAGWGLKHCPGWLGYHWHRSSATAKLNYNVQLPIEALPPKEQLYLIRKAVDSFTSTRQPQTGFFKENWRGNLAKLFALEAGRSQPLLWARRTPVLQGYTSQHATPRSLKTISHACSNSRDVGRTINLPKSEIKS